MISHLQKALQKYHDAHHWRERSCVHTESPRLLSENNNLYLNFSSNDYCGLSQHPSVIEATVKAIQTYGVGSCSAPTITGFHPIQATLEEKLKSVLGCPYGFVMSNGYLANIGTLNALSATVKNLLLDKSVHASILDGARLSQIPFKRFRHNDCNHLEQHLKTITSPLVAIESVYSMSGQTAPLLAIQALTQKYDAFLYCDDAHGLGVLGGSFGALKAGLQPDPKLIYMATLSKALGSYGAFIGCFDKTVYHTLLQFTRTHLFNTALPPALNAASLAALTVLETEPHWWNQLQRNIALFRECAATYELPIGHSHTAIQTVMLKEASKAVHVSEALKSAGFWVTAIRPPTVPPNQSLLRIVLNAHHTQSDISRLVEKLADLCNPAYALISHDSAEEHCGG